ncbi:AGE family epimerase/isomerase [Lentimicrobium sp. S6]|uniref:AGE family epimerase/isomerase n=1 Tax=Lentimicrobium sp. S6 TaxID=2735872 RepID=UPI00155169CA|nr:AGE family epimerase/isomerase [Lentimicrobium sp. S6]NPD45741.1 N-acyl-D-glucosamine 2-epimerase [Lentimicrobium sp. S6]
MNLKIELEQELVNHLLPFWLNKTKDEINGGFMGQINYLNEINTNAPKAAILNFRILWTFSAAYNFKPNPEYLRSAEQSFLYIKEHFIDHEYGGTFWLLDKDGESINDRKQAYALSFAMYGLSEYYKASGDEMAKDLAVQLFHDIENHFYDTENQGYIEALARNWDPLEDMRLSDKDMNAPFTMNTHLHILEAYTNLYRIWPNSDLAKALNNLLFIHRDRIMDDKTHHLELFFNRKWESQNQVISYGHDIEAAWLMLEATKALNDTEIIKEFETILIKISKVTMEKGIHEDGSILYEGNPSGVMDTDRHWWPQFEAMVGFMNAYEITEDEAYLKVVKGLWKFTKSHLKHESGEWWWRVNEEYLPNVSDDLVGPWKGPYHNSRGMMEVIRILSATHTN